MFPILGDYYGRQFDYSGFTFIVDGLPKGDYLLGVYALTSVKPGAFQAQFRNIRIE